MIRNGDYADVIYLSPKNVISYAQRGNVLDLTSYIEADETLIAQLESIWSKSLAFYATTGTQNVTDIAFDEESGHFVDTSTDEQAHVFGLPKDYSNFTLGYNRNYFTDEMKAAYTTLKASTARNVSTRLLDATQSTGYAAGITHTGGSNTADAITYATTGTYTNPYTGETIEAVEGEEAPFVAIGVPITYKPFNYYLYTNYNDARAISESSRPARSTTRTTRATRSSSPASPARPSRSARIRRTHTTGMQRMMRAPATSF